MREGPRRGEIWAFERGRGDPVPLLVVQADALNGAAPTLVGLVVTSRAQAAGEPLALALDAQAAGLSAPAWVKVSQVHTVPVTDARERLGGVAPSTLERVGVALAQVLGITTPAGAP